MKCRYCKKDAVVEYTCWVEDGFGGIEYCRRSVCAYHWRWSVIDHNRVLVMFIEGAARITLGGHVNPSNHDLPQFEHISCEEAEKLWPC